MTSPRSTWDNLKADYLREVEASLSSVTHPNMREVLDDVASHLDERFAELQPDELAAKHFQAIIAEMGPASDYGELLAPRTLPAKPKAKRKYLPWIALFALVFAGAIILPSLLSPPARYIVNFKAVAPFKPQSAKDLLDSFNAAVKFRVTTHHFRTDIQDSELIGHICTDSQADKGAIATILARSKTLTLIGIESVTSKELEAHYAMDQPSLNITKPTVVKTTPRAFATDVSAELTEITVIFDQPMMNLSWSWVGGGETFPETIGQPRYDPARTTCTLPVKLQPGTFYWMADSTPKRDMWVKNNW